MISKFIKITLLVILVVLLAGISAYLTLTFFVKGEETVVVPTLGGKNVVDVLQMLSDLGLNTRVAGSEYHHSVPLHHVIHQEPAPGVEIKKNRDVKIVISKGRRDIRVPDLTGMAFRQGLVLLEKNGLCAGVQSLVYSNDQEEDTIVAQSPPAGVNVNIDECVDLLVSVGSRPRFYEMPDLKGLQLEEAILALEKHHLRFGKFRTDFRRGKRINRIIDQEPVAGYRVAEGTVVDLLVNRRPTEGASDKLDLHGGVRLFRFKSDNGFIKTHIRVTVNWLGMTSEFYNGYMQPGREFWFLIPRGNDVGVKVFQDDILILSEVFQD